MIMKIEKLNLVYFSPSGTTEKIVNAISGGINIDPITVYNIFHGQRSNISIPGNELTVFGVPVYSGRIPGIAKESLKYFKGNASPAIVVCVYGNREYEDALLELKDTVEAENFKVIAAGAFIAEHCIFPGVAHGRPDNSDKTKASEFGNTVSEKIRSLQTIGTIPEIHVDGNYPYKEAKGASFHPVGDSKCTECGNCTEECPVQAINDENPRETDPGKCIACTRCIKICPVNSRNFQGEMYAQFREKFETMFAARKEPELFL